MWMTEKIVRVAYSIHMIRICNMVHWWCWCCGKSFVVCRWDEHPKQHRDRNPLSNCCSVVAVDLLLLAADAAASAWILDDVFIKASPLSRYIRLYYSLIWLYDVCFKRCYTAQHIQRLGVVGKPALSRISYECFWQHFVSRLLFYSIPKPTI